ncbi:hypothetical protein NBRC10512_006205 [Rhodotorula toruloides]|uniref:RHTO0S09e05072g1_1 n=2 Tax=Rhodotorula toruloides TaxID=5286 RepID=A0A061B4T5_RHOTO|nr:uncharacterized protein RHTO_07707 [Rhodotorula toruloides NP11]EMS22837.1 hypothetical protein RHTO_07707 [Rhodotorula toruloides NP11]CDR44503.1 RHTO0S09e05072g1_1 [Rhodotorula toruloides]
MSTLKAALRFPPAYPPPPPPPPPEPQHRTLTSRFSADTLIIKSPPRPFQRIFTSANSSPSPPASPLAAATKRYHRRMSSTAKRHDADGDRRSASDDAETRSRRRPSLEDQQRRPRRSHSASRSRTASSGSTTAAEKLAGAAKEVIEKLALRRPGHARQRSGASEASVETLASGRSRPRSTSSPSPGPVRPGRVPERPASPPFKLVDLPPRSDSRNAAVADVKPHDAHVPAPPSLASSASNGAHPGRLPALAASRPRPKRIPPHLPLHQRPTSPPSPSIPPLRPAPSQITLDSHSTAFKAMLVKPPTFAAILTKSASELLVRIDIGGQSTYATTVETLLATRDGGNAVSGRLGEFVESILDDVRRTGAKLARLAEQPPRVRGATTEVDVSVKHLDIPARIPTDDESSASSISRTPSFAPSPLPASPFPFADDCFASDTAGDIVFSGGEDPASPIDPLVSTAAAVIAAKNILSASRGAGAGPSLVPQPPPALESCDVQRVCVVESQAAVAGRHKSIHPDLGHTLSFGPEMASPLPFVVSSSVARYDDCASFDFSSAFRQGLEPFFDVVRGQAHESLSLLSPPSWPIDSSPSPSSPVTVAMFPSSPDGVIHAQQVAVERASLDYGLSDDALEEMVGLVAAPQRDGAVAASTTSARTPSLCSSESDAPQQAASGGGSACRHPTRPVSLDDLTMHIFLDRTDAALPTATPHHDLDTASPLLLGESTYGCLLRFFRTGRLPPSLVLPRDPLTTAALDVEPLYLSLFSLNPSPLFALTSALRTVEAEAGWLGCSAVQTACKFERNRVQQVVEWLSTTKAGAQGGQQGNCGRTEGRPARVGWI